MSGKFVFIDAEYGVDALTPDRVFELTGARRDEFAVLFANDDQDVLITGTTTELYALLKRIERRLDMIAPRIPWFKRCLECDLDLSVETGAMGVAVFVKEPGPGRDVFKPQEALLCVEHGGNGKNTYGPETFALRVEQARARHPWEYRS